MRQLYRWVAFGILLCVGLACPCVSLEVNDTTAASNGAAIDIFMDCDYCDDDYLRTEISMANFVRDRLQADVHILITRLQTGSGGREYTIEYIGQHAFTGMRDTLLYYSRESDTDDDVRSGLLRTIRTGLARFVARTPQAAHLSITYSAPVEPAEVKDNWNYWVFEIGTDVWMDAESSQRSVSIGGDIEASRVTEQLRLEFELFGDYSETIYEDADLNDVFRNSKGVEALAIWSLGDHWSAGAVSDGLSSTYGNTRIRVSMGPGLEYNYFPYSESTRRQFRFYYLLTVGYTDYFEETIFDKHNQSWTKEELWAGLEITEPWGEACVSLSGSHYFHDFSKYRLNLDASMSLRLYEGFRFNLHGYASRVHDQLNLRKGTASKEDILTTRYELATNYRHSVSFGISYTFGSIYNNVVNPRFGY